MMRFLLQRASEGKESRASVRQWLQYHTFTASDRATAAFIRLHRFARYPDPEGSPPTNAALWAKAVTLKGPKPKASHFGRLRKFYDRGAPCGCVHCRRNTQCFVLGCNARPLDSANDRLSTGFRCIPGEMHCCNKHGLDLNVGRYTIQTISKYLPMKDGTIDTNPYEQQHTGMVEHSKHDPSHEDSPKRHRLRLERAAVRAVFWANQYNVAHLDAETALMTILSKVAQTIQSKPKVPSLDSGAQWRTTNAIPHGSSASNPSVLPESRDGKVLNDRKRKGSGIDDPTSCTRRRGAEGDPPKKGRAECGYVVPKVGWNTNPPECPRPPTPAPNAGLACSFSPTEQPNPTGEGWAAPKSLRDGLGNQRVEHPMVPIDFQTYF